MAGVRGRLVSAAFATTVLPDLSGVSEAPPHVQRAIARWDAARQSSVGPASSLRAVSDLAVSPLLMILGFHVESRRLTTDESELTAIAGRTMVPVLVGPWSASLDALWRHAVLCGVAADARWCVCTNGRLLRIIDSQRTWARQHLEFDLDTIAHEPEALTLLWTLARADAFGGAAPWLDRASQLSARHGIEVCRSLGHGVLDALRTVLQALAEGCGRSSPSLPALLEQSLTVLYRVLFLLFAEARGLVPVWHPIYRDRYTIDAIVTTLLEGRRYRGLWQALQAIARLAHAGCRAGDLRVTAFNGRLFSPSHTRLAERGRVDDETMTRAVLAMSTTTSGRAGRARIVYRDLDVEQLGAIYEQVLDYEVARDETRAVTLRRSGDLRKASGTFYTPRSVTSYLVRRTLAPLVEGRTAEEILALRIVDPAMGSGAFLVAACDYLASAAEQARVRDGEWHAADVTQADRIGLRRDVAQRCVFGADLNPMAVQLARLSLWLATLAGDKPLTFLDHRLAVGDSLIGASLGDLVARPPGRGGRGRPQATLPLFDREDLGRVVSDVVAARVRLALERDEAAEIVRRKESVLAALSARGSAVMRWKAVLDLWCACWFWDDGSKPTPAMFTELSDALLRGQSVLPPKTTRDWRARAANIAAARRFLHWELEFPEVFFDADGRRAPHSGFDAVIGNPPWDMVRGDSGDEGTREDRRAEARQLVEFVRDAGVYTCSARSHVNRYQLFVERALQLARPGGRIGLVLPSGLATDAGSASLRRHLFDRAKVDSLVGLDNRAGIFPIHRSVRFVLLTATAGPATDRIACRFGVSDPEPLDAVGDHASNAGAFPVTVSRAFLARVSGDDDLAIPELVSALDLHIVEKITAAHPWLSAAEGWHAQFGRELNASDDRGAFVPATGARTARPVLEGKQVSPFRVAVDQSRHELSASAMFGARVPRRARLAYRDVASATNRLTLIAAIVPARAVTTHTLFCLKTPLSIDRQQVLCALLNSFVANYLVRMRVNTHVTAAILSRLAVPFLAQGDETAERLATLAAALADAARPIEEMPEYVEMQALAARAYGLSREELSHVLGTFPLIPLEVREATVATFRAVH